MLTIELTGDTHTHTHTHTEIWNLYNILTFLSFYDRMILTITLLLRRK